MWHSLFTSGTLLTGDFWQRREDGCVQMMPNNCGIEEYRGYRPDSWILTVPVGTVPSRVTSTWNIPLETFLVTVFFS